MSLVQISPARFLPPSAIPDNNSWLAPHAGPYDIIVLLLVSPTQLPATDLIELSDFTLVGTFGSTPGPFGSWLYAPGGISLSEDETAVADLARRTGSSLCSFVVRNGRTPIPDTRFASDVQTVTSRRATWSPPKLPRTPDVPDTDLTVIVSAAAVRFQFDTRDFPVVISATEKTTPILQRSTGLAGAPAEIGVVLDVAPATTGWDVQLHNASPPPIPYAVAASSLAIPLATPPKFRTESSFNPDKQVWETLGDPRHHVVIDPNQPPTRDWDVIWIDETTAVTDESGVALGDLSDVTITNPAVPNTLMYDSSQNPPQWVNRTLSSIYMNITGAQTATASKTFSKSPLIELPSQPSHMASKDYVDLSLVQVTPIQPNPVKSKLWVIPNPGTSTLIINGPAATSDYYYTIPGDPSKMLSGGNFTVSKNGFVTGFELIISGKSPANGQCNAFIDSGYFGLRTLPPTTNGSPGKHIVSANNLQILAGTHTIGCVTGGNPSYTTQWRPYVLSDSSKIAWTTLQFWYYTNAARDTHTESWQDEHGLTLYERVIDRNTKELISETGDPDVVTVS